MTTKDNMDNFPLVPMEVVERSLYDGGTYFLIQTALDRDGWEVAEVRPDIPWQLKTAQLLAAAPELLEALEELTRINHLHNESIKVVLSAPEGWCDSYLDKARAAIAKAKGQQHD